MVLKLCDMTKGRELLWIVWGYCESIRNKTSGMQGHRIGKTSSEEDLFLCPINKIMDKLTYGILTNVFKDCKA